MQLLQTEVASRHEGCMLLRRLQQRLLAAVKAATKVTSCCEGCYRLLRRLPHRLQAATKASITVTGFYEGCHKGCMLLQRLNDAMKAATELVSSWEGCNIGCQAVVKAAVKTRTKLAAFAEAAIYVVGWCEGYNDAWWPLKCRRQLQRSWQRSWVAVMEIIPIDQRRFDLQASTHRGTAKMERTFEEKVGLRGEGWWPSRRRLVAFAKNAWGFTEKARGFAKKDKGFAEKARGFAEKARGFAEKGMGFSELNRD
ncbi:hypothetical protein Tco_1220225 [Tanacetum coccineum]